MKQGDSFLKVKMSILNSIDSTNRFAQNNQEIQCKPKCTGCCKRLIFITIAEAIVILQNIDDSYKMSVLEKAKELSEPSLLSNNISWFKMNISCPLLSEEELCITYRVRPIVCSTHYSGSHPSLCGPWSCSGKPYKTIDDVDTHNAFMKEIVNSGLSHNVLLQRLPLPAALISADTIMKTRWKEWEQVIKIMVKR